MNRKKTLPLLILSILLTGCETEVPETPVESVNPPATSETNTIPVLKNVMFDEVGNESITYVENIKGVNASKEFDYTVMTEFSKDCFLGKIVDDVETRNVVSKLSYYSKNGKVAFSSHPDKYNKVKENVTSVNWAKSVYVNNLGNLSKDVFDYVSKDDFGTATYSMSTTAITSKATKEIVDKIYNSASSYIHGGTDSKFGGDNLVKMDLYVTKKGISGFYLKYSKVENETRAYTELTVSLENVGSTTLTKDDVCPSPYTHASELNSRYASLTAALNEMKGYNYQIDVEIKREATPIQRSKGVFFADGYSGYDESISNGKSTFSYYGIHKRTDGKYERYGGNTADELKGEVYRTAPHQGLMNFDFSGDIFEYDRTKSTDTKSVFSINPDFKLYNSISDISEDMTYDEFATYANGLTLEVENNHLTSFSFGFSDNLENKYTFVEKVTNHGGVTSVPNEIAGFSNYKEYVSPSSFKEVSVGVFSMNTMTIAYTSNAEAIIRNELYNASALPLLPFPLVGDAAYYYDSATFIPASIIPAALYFFFDEGTDEIATVYKKIKASINSAGYSLVDSDEKSATQTINNTYEITLEYSSGSICLSYSTPISYEN